VLRSGAGRKQLKMTVYDETIATIRQLASRARAVENVLFCEQRPLTSLEAQYAGIDDLASELREIEDDAIRALKRLVDAEEGYEAALQSIEEAGADSTGWLRAVILARSLETVPASL
jgi:DNA repair exonuclease SbcCD ATPase subunit